MTGLISGSKFGEGLYMEGARILYIEDNADNRLLVKRILLAEGYTMLEAESGTRGLELAKTGLPDLILMDINLPDIDGYECTARLRQSDGLSKVPIIALTANVMEGDSQKALDAGCDGYIPKPVDVDALPLQVEAFLKKSRALRDAEVKSPSAGELSDAAVKTPSAGELSDAAVKTPSASELSDAAVKTPSAGELSDAAVKTPSASELRDAAVKTPSASELSDAAMKTSSANQ
jgi:two-component system cell cycle response regulator DivK